MSKKLIFKKLILYKANRVTLKIILLLGAIAIIMLCTFVNLKTKDYIKQEISKHNIGTYKLISSNYAFPFSTRVNIQALTINDMLIKEIDLILPLSNLLRSKQKIFYINIPGLITKEVQLAKLSGKFFLNQHNKIFGNINIKKISLHPAQHATPLDLSSDVTKISSKLNAKIDLNIDSIYYQNAKIISNSNSLLELNQTYISLLTNKAKLLEGHLSNHLSYHFQTTAFSNDTKLVKFKLPEILKQTENQNILTFNLTSTGNTIAQLLNNLAGTFLLEISSGMLTKEIKHIGDNFIVNILSTMFKQKNKNANNLRCAVVKFNLEDGMAITNRGIAINTQTIDIIGHGKINLKNQKLHLKLFANKKNHLLKVNNYSLDQILLISGSLQKPKLTLNPVGIAKTAGSITSALISGGTSLFIESLIATIKNKMQKKDYNICQDAKNS